MKSIDLAEAEAQLTMANAEKEAEANNVATIDTQVAEREANIDELKGKLKKAGDVISEHAQGYDQLLDAVERKSQMVTEGTQMTPLRMKHAENSEAVGEELEALRGDLMASLDARQASLDDNQALLTENRELKEELATLKEGHAEVMARNEKLEAENSELGEKNAKLMGHTNNKQKIQHVMELKKENHELKKEVDSLRSKASGLARKSKRCEEEMAKLAKKTNTEVYDFEKEESLLQELKTEQNENEKLTHMFERLAQEVFDVSDAKVVASLAGAEQAGRMIQPDAVLDTCLSNLQDLSTKIETQERSLKDHDMQVTLLKDKMRLMAQASISSVA